MNGTDAAAVRKDQGQFACAARECASEQLGSAERNPVCGRAGLQVAWPTGPVRQLAHHLCLDEPSGEEGVLDRVFEKLQLEQIVRIKIEAFALDSTSVKVHPDGTGRVKKGSRRPSANPGADGTRRFIWLRECSNGHDLRPLAGQRDDAPEGRALLAELGPMPEKVCLLMDRAYEATGPPTGA